MQKLKAEQMEREYQKITSNVECQVFSIKQFKIHLSDHLYG